MHSAWDYKDYCVISLWNKLFHDISRATFLAPTCLLLLKGECWQGGAHSSIAPLHRSFYWKLNLLQRVWLALVGISISAAVEADYMGVVPHTGSDTNLLQREGLLWCYWLMLSSACMRAISWLRSSRLYWWHATCDLWCIFCFCFWFMAFAMVKSHI